MEHAGRCRRPGRALPRLAGRAAAPRTSPRYAEAGGKGQSPKAMIITCCDSRVLISEIFGNEPGDFFIHRNIANLVPPHEPDGRSHGTSAAIEYAVIALGIEHLVVMGHHGCGGVRGCHDMLAGLAPDLDTPTSFVGTWLRLLKPGYEALAGRGLDYEARIAALEKEAVLVSLAQPDDLPLRRARRSQAGRLQLHGVWKDIRDGGLEVYDAGGRRLRAALIGIKRELTGRRDAVRLRSAGRPWFRIARSSDRCPGQQGGTP